MSSSVRVNRAEIVLAVSRLDTSVRFYTGVLGLDLVASHEDPPYATVAGAGTTRISLAEQGYPAVDRPGVQLMVPADMTRASVVLVLEVADADAAKVELATRGARFLATGRAPGWENTRYFCVDPDGYLIGIEQPRA